MTHNQRSSEEGRLSTPEKVVAPRVRGGEATGLVQALVLDEQGIERETLVADFMAVVEEMDPNQSRPVDDGLVRLALHMLTTKKDESPSDAMQRWIHSLLNLRARVPSTNLATALVLAWMLDLCESGTAKKFDADFLTRRRYCVIAARPLWRMLSPLGNHPHAWDKDELKAAYQALMEDPSIRDKAALGAALSAFQFFLCEQWDIELPLMSLHKLIPAPRPRVQLVTNTEIWRAQDWIARQSGGDKTLLRMAGLALALGAAAPFRLRELLHLRLRNITFQENASCEIEIVRYGWRHKLKSVAAGRRVQIHDPRVLAILNRCLEQRRLEGAASNDLLFASPLTPSEIYRHHALHRTLLRVLKLASGDPSMTFHALRHSWASRAVSDVLQTNSIVDFNRLIQVADQMGHVTPSTTLHFYAHLFEDALEAHSSAALRASLQVTPKTAQRLAGVLPNSLNTQARRKGLKISDAIWRSICMAADNRSFPALTSRMECTIR